MIDKVRSFLECVFLAWMIVIVVLALANPVKTGEYIGKIVNGYESTHQVR